MHRFSPRQFEPNFEAIDLLQMHNRNFVVNMVIGGEKTPAFSARTLELPPSQADNTPHIIEHSRRMYSRNREDVEKEIDAAIKPVRNQKSNQPNLSRSLQTTLQRSIANRKSSNPQQTMAKLFCKFAAMIMHLQKPQSTQLHR